MSAYIRIEDNHYNIGETRKSEWILGKIDRVIIKGLDGQSFVNNGPLHLFTHQSLYFSYRKNIKGSRDFNAIVMFFHLLKWGKSHNLLKSENVLKIICQSSQGKNDLVKNGVDENKIVVVPTGVDTHLFRPKTPENSPLKIGCVATCLDRKGSKVLPKTIERLPQTKWVVIGQKWQDTFKTLQNVTYHDDVDYNNYPRYYSLFDIFFCASLVEGGPVPLMEAMCCGYPCVMSDTGFARDLINHGVNGFIYPPGDIETAIKYLKLLLVDPQLRKAMGHQAHETVKHRSWCEYGKQIASVINET